MADSHNEHKYESIVIPRVSKLWRVGSLLCWILHAMMHTLLGTNLIQIVLRPLELERSKIEDEKQRNFREVAIFFHGPPPRWFGANKTNNRNSFEQIIQIDAYSHSLMNISNRSHTPHFLEVSGLMLAFVYRPWIELITSLHNYWLINCGRLMLAFIYRPW